MIWPGLTSLAGSLAGPLLSRAVCQNQAGRRSFCLPRSRIINVAVIIHSTGTHNWAGLSYLWHKMSRLRQGTGEANKTYTVTASLRPCQGPLEQHCSALCHGVASSAQPWFQHHHTFVSSRLCLFFSSARPYGQRTIVVLCSLWVKGRSLGRACGQAREKNMVKGDSLLIIIGMWAPLPSDPANEGDLASPLPSFGLTSRHNVRV